jgi:hypothetical protein
MKTAGYIGSLLPDGDPSIAANVVRELDLHPNDPVQVVLVALPGDDSDERRTAARAEIWQQLDALRDRLSARECNLTEALLQAREEEDASL